MWNKETSEQAENKISAKGIAMISESLKTNRVLTELNLCDNSFGIEGVRMMSESLKVNTALHTLGLSSDKNNIR